MKNKQIVAIVLVLVIVLVGVTIFNLTRPKPNLTVNMAPTVAKLTLNNGKTIKNGKQYLSPGTYVVKATMAGFGDVTQRFTVTKTSNTLVTILLDPNSSIGENYIKRNPAQGLNREAIGGKQSTDAAVQAIDKTPLINQLPYIGPGYEFQIDYGTGSDNIAKIIITAPNDASKKDALTWISKQGYDTSKLNIEYRTTQPGIAHNTSPGQ